MEEVSDTVRHLASGINENGRKKLIDGLRDLSYSIETPDDTLHRLKYMVKPSVFQYRSEGCTMLMIL